MAQTKYPFTERVGDTRLGQNNCCTGDSRLYLDTLMNPTPTTPLPTQFAPAERASVETVRQQAAKAAQQPWIESLNSVLNYILILNQQRQIVFASRNVLELVPGAELKGLLGKRPGEALGCAHPDETTGGCGTTAFCRECGATKSILTSLAGKRDCQECRMMRIVNSEEVVMDLLVACTPLMIEGERFSLAAIADISHEKRRRALEKIFFHDVINSAGGLEGLIQMINEQAPADIRDDIDLLRAGVTQVVEEIFAQRDLMAAENDELAVELNPLNSRTVLEKVLHLYANHPAAEYRELRLASDAESLDLVTDQRLLGRVLGNLIKNALEAAQRGHVVTAGCTGEGDGVRFWVHNPTVMPPGVQLQIFNRSFSTKGSGRGLGTYSVKLLTERYLKGKVGFTTSKEGGTTFFVTLPKRLAVTPTTKNISQ